MKKTLTLLLTFCLFFAATFTLQGAFADEVELLGAGATFPYPLYSKMFSVYHEQYGVKVNYQAIGSGGGIRQLLNRTVDFGATDAFMSNEEIRSVKNPILHLTTCLGAVVISYNLPEAPELKLTGRVIADIFLGRITKWNDPQIVALNPQVNLPALNIMPVHRSDGSGTTYIFSEYLSKISREWEEKVGKGKALNWPAGLGAKGNTGVAGLVKQIPGAIGYIELTYALQAGMPFALIKNASGNFIKPTFTSVSLAANVDLPPDTRISITDTQAGNGYPISSFTWLIFYKEQDYDRREKKKAEELVKLLWWIVHEGQKFCKPLHYAPLPDNAVDRAEDILSSVLYRGKPILKESF